MDTNKLESDIKMDSYLVEHLSSDLRNYQSLIAHTEAQLQSLRSIANAAQQQLQEAQERLSASCGVKAGVEAIVRSRDMSQSEQGEISHMMGDSVVMNKSKMHYGKEGLLDIQIWTLVQYLMRDLTPSLQQIELCPQVRLGGSS